MSANNPFYSGKVAMIAEGEWQVTFIPKYAPSLDWGVAPLPTPEGVEPLVMGWPSVVDCIPRGSHHPREAWSFIKWFYSARHGGGPSPASDYCYAIHNVCARKKDVLQERFASNPKFKVFVDALLTRKVVSLPTMPEITLYTDELERQREMVVFRKTTPEAALKETQQKVNAELEQQRRFAERSRCRATTGETCETDCFLPARTLRASCCSRCTR
jgi:ABC-type glycerol-3-phosphate transport system substrate-binding protein